MQVLLDALSNMFRHSPVGIDHQQGKFVTAIACGQICRPAMFLHDRRKPAKRTVPRQVALKIIDAFELIQIQKQKRKGVMTAVGAAHFRLELVHELSVVGQTCQPVVACLVKSSFFGLFAVRDVHRSAQTPDDLARTGAQGPHPYLQHGASPSILKVGDLPLQCGIVLDDGGGVWVGGSQKLTHVSPYEGPRANFCDRQAHAPLRADPQFPIRGP